MLNKQEFKNYIVADCPIIIERHISRQKCKAQLNPRTDSVTVYSSTGKQMEYLPTDGIKETMQRINLMSL